MNAPIASRTGVDEKAHRESAGSAISAAFDAATASNAGANGTQALSDGLKTAQSALPTLILSFFALFDVANLAEGISLENS